MEYEIIFDYRVINQDFKSIGETVKKRIIREVGKKLKTAPFDFGKPLKFELKKLFRMRVGDYRVIYHINSNKLHVTILKIGHRSEVYEEVLKRI